MRWFWQWLLRLLAVISPQFSEYGERGDDERLR
jgi:hypothetical protein